MSDELTAVYMYSRRQAIARIEELEAKICDLEILLRKKTERIVELEAKTEIVTGKHVYCC